MLSIVISKRNTPDCSTLDHEISYSTGFLRVVVTFEKAGEKREQTNPTLLKVFVL